MGSAKILAFRVIRPFRAISVPAGSGSVETFPSETREEEEEEVDVEQSHQLQCLRHFIAGLPEREQPPFRFRQFRGVWFHEFFLQGILAARQHFVARPDDIVLASRPKCGTTWLKSLAFSVASRDGDRHPRSPRHPLLTANPHECVPIVEMLHSRPRDKLAPSSPRLVSTHMPWPVLRDSVEGSSTCRLVYICREPKDALTSLWHFWKGIQDLPSGEFEAIFEMFCTGVIPFGPIWEHALGYWEEHRRRPNEVMFLRYEDLKREPAAVVRRLAAFLGNPFSQEEERDGVVEDVLSLCSLENMKGLEVNKGGMLRGTPVQKKLYFRKGEVGDWANLLTPEMAERIDGITQDKLRGSGLIL